MTKRLAPAFMALGLGLAALAWGLLSLQAVFARELYEAIEALDGRQKALALYARKTLDQELEKSLALKMDMIVKARENPLLPDNGLLLFRGGRQVLPRPVVYKPSAASSAMSIFTAMTKGDLKAIADDEDDSPWDTRLGLFHEFATALELGDVPAMESAFRKILVHRTRFRVGPVKDIAYMAALLEVFKERGDPDPDLMRLMLRDSIKGATGLDRLEGAQRALLQWREKFTKEDFDFLAEKVANLSERSGVSHADFLDMAAKPPSPPMPPPNLDGPFPAIYHGGWYLKVSGGEVFGVAVRLDGLADGISESMIEAGLLDRGDWVSVSIPQDGQAPAAGLDVQANLKARAGQLEDIAKRYRYKTGLAIFCGILSIAAVVLLLVAQARKERLLSMRADFVAAVSHEFKTPLSSVRLIAETLERKLSGMPEARDYPSRMVRHIDSLSFLVDNILSFNRLEKGGWVLSKSMVHLDEALAAVREELAGHWPVQVNFEAKGLGGLAVEADHDLVALLFRNLADNAVKHNRRTPVDIMVEAKAGRGDILILFSDNGPGIPEEEWEMVFTEFYRRRSGDNSQERGSGLGLAICRRIMNEHGGSIEVASSSPQGTVFKLVFRKVDS